MSKGSAAFDKWGRGLYEWAGWKQKKMKANQQKQPMPKDDANGLVVPGYKYLGPGNGLDKGDPVNSLDSAAKVHDEGYAKDLANNDANPYVHFNEHDLKMQQMLEANEAKMGIHEKIAANGVRALWQLKKNVMPENVHPDNKHANDNSIVENTVSDSEMDSSGPSSSKRGIDQVDGAVSNQSSKQAKSGGEGGSDMGGGLVGSSVPSIYWGTTWKGKTVTTNRSLRVQFSNEFTGPELPYKVISGGGGMYKILSDWKMLDYNRMNAHFVPKDLQYLWRNCSKWRPKRVKVTYHSMQCTQEVTVGGTTTTQLVPTGACEVAVRKFGELPYRMNGRKYDAEGIFDWEIPNYPIGLEQMHHYMYVHKKPIGIQYTPDATFLVEHGKIEHMGPMDKFSVETHLKAEWLYNYDNYGHVLDLGIDPDSSVEADKMDDVYESSALKRNFTVARVDKTYTNEKVWVSTDNPETGSVASAASNNPDAVAKLPTSLDANARRPKFTGAAQTLILKRNEAGTANIWAQPTQDAPRVLDSRCMATSPDVPIWVLRPKGLFMGMGALQSGGHMLERESDVPPMVLFRCRPMYGKKGVEIPTACNLVMQIETEWEVEYSNNLQAGMSGHSTINIGDGGLDLETSTERPVGVVWKEQKVPNVLDGSWPGPHPLCT